jgi:simple sugar transport system ATP-binding protein
MSAIDAELTKRYGTREVLSKATLVVRPGTVHALVGENGAGKSTLVKIVAGVVHSDAGKLTIAGAPPVVLAGWDRIAARAAGIGIVQQHGASAGTLTVVENAVLGVEPGGLLIELGPTHAKLRALGDRVGMPIDPGARTDELGLGAAQRAEIVAALHVVEASRGAKVLILDEPTAVLTPVEVEGLLATLRKLAAEGVTIVIVTHKLDEVKTVADDVTVLRAGKTVATFSTGTGGPAGGIKKTLDVGAIAKAMVGSELPAAEQLAPPAADAGEALGLSHVTVGDALLDVTLAVKRGELVGVAGVDGNGQRELALAIAGLLRHAGEIRIAGRVVGTASTARRLASFGLAHIPEDRHHGGLLLDASVADNLALGRRDITGRFTLDRGAMRKHAEAQIETLDIRPPDPDALANALSGGNQQKIVVARELSRPDLRAVIAAQPTRGVDLGAVARIHGQLRAAATSGAGVLVISADLDELLSLCHRIVVLLRGRIAGERSGAALRTGDAREALGVLMTGAAA